ncbi:MAG TPA: RNA polymerase sigma factor [Flavobacterium sp.]|nr:RNA polymerase sigma factor [Flavobacterium sp.]
MEDHSRDFEAIYAGYGKMAYNVALHYLQNIEDAEEITQDVFVQVYHSMHQFREQSALKTWIYRITINKCIDFTKHKNSLKRRFVFGKRPDESVLHNISDFEHPGILLENKENAAILFGVINTLPENQKTAFLLSKVDHLSNPEISAIMELSISAVESLVFRAKASLQEKLAKKFTAYRKKK